MCSCGMGTGAGRFLALGVHKPLLQEKGSAGKQHFPLPVIPSRLTAAFEVSVQLFGTQKESEEVVVRRIMRRLSRHFADFDRALGEAHKPLDGALPHDAPPATMPMPPGTPDRPPATPHLDANDGGTVVGRPPALVTLEARENIRAAEAVRPPQSPPDASPKGVEASQFGDIASLSLATRTEEKGTVIGHTRTQEADLGALQKPGPLPGNTPDKKLAPPPVAPQAAAPAQNPSPQPNARKPAVAVEVKKPPGAAGAHMPPGGGRPNPQQRKEPRQPVGMPAPLPSVSRGAEASNIMFKDASAAPDSSIDFLAVDRTAGVRKPPAQMPKILGLSLVDWAVLLFFLALSFAITWYFLVQSKAL